MTDYTIDQLADLFQEAGINSPFSVSYEDRIAWAKANPDAEVPPYNHFREHARLGLDESRLPKGWETAVHDALGRRRLAATAAKVEEKVKCIPEPIQTFIRENRRSTTFEPKKRDLSDLAKLATQDRRWKGSDDKLYGPTPYKPEAGCNLRLLLKEAYCYDTEQAAYADHQRYVVPVRVDGEPGDLETCRRNLRAFMESLRTHNGMAGSGCNWEAQLHAMEDGFVVHLGCRASIMD